MSACIPQLCARELFEKCPNAQFESKHALCGVRVAVVKSCSGCTTARAARRARDAEARCVLVYEYVDEDWVSAVAREGLLVRFELIYLLVMYVCAHTYICIVCMTHIYIYIYMYVCIHTYKHIYIHAYAHIHTYVYMYIMIAMTTRSMYIFMYNMCHA